MMRMVKGIGVELLIDTRTAVCLRRRRQRRIERDRLTLERPKINQQDGLWLAESRHGQQ